MSHVLMRIYSGVHLPLTFEVFHSLDSALLPGLRPPTLFCTSAMWFLSLVPSFSNAACPLLFLNKRLSGTYGVPGSEHVVVITGDSLICGVPEQVGTPSVLRF